jgi:hypothetical protein
MNSVMNTDHERRILALEKQLSEVSMHARRAWEAEQERSRKELERLRESRIAWELAFKGTVILTVAAAWGLLLFKR